MGIIYIIIGLFLALLGVGIWRFEWTGLLSNVEPAAITNRKGLARWAGSCLLMLGGMAISAGIITRFITAERGELMAGIGFMIASQLLMVVYLSGLQRYTK